MIFREGRVWKIVTLQITRVCKPSRASGLLALVFDLPESTWVGK